MTLPLWVGEGAGAVSANGTVPGEFKLNSSPNPPNDEQMLGIEWTDDRQVVTHRLTIMRGTVTDTADNPTARTSVIALGMTFTAMAIDAATRSPH